MLLSKVWFNDNLREPDDSLSTVSSAGTIRDLLELPSDLDNSRFRKSYIEANYYGTDFLNPVSSDTNIDSATSFYRVTIHGPSGPENKLIKTGCIAILNNCINQLTVLTSAYKPIVGDVERRDITYRPLVERYKLDNSVDYGDYVINANYTNFHKLSRDAKTLIVVLQDVRDELDVFGYATLLGRYIKSESRMQQDETEFLEEVEGKQRFFDDLNRTYKNLKVETAKKVQELKERTRGLFTTIKDDMEYTRRKVSFTRKWEAARREQNTMVLESQEGRYKKIIEDMERAKTLDNTVHEDIEKFFSEVYDDNLHETERWMNTYDREFEERDMDIYRIKNRTELLIEKKEGLAREYERRTQAMEEWMVYKREKKEAEERLALENWAAIRIQAWWRGVMVRRHLGPYRKKKKKKGKGGKGKDKKKVKGAKRSK